MLKLQTDKKQTEYPIQTMLPGELGVVTYPKGYEGLLVIRIQGGTVAAVNGECKWSAPEISQLLVHILPKGTQLVIE